MHNSKSPRVGTLLVTGAAGALGRAVAEKFKAAGWKVYGADRGSDPQLAVLTGFTSVDFSNAAQVRATFEGAAWASHVDCVIHCAGGFKWTLTEGIEDSDVEFLVGANLKSGIHLARSFVPLLKKRPWGRIFFVGAFATQHVGAGMGLYAATKSGLQSFALGLAEELKSTAVSVNCILPSILDTPGNRKDMPDADFSKWVKLEDIGAFFLSLCQPECDAVRGALIPMTGKV